MKYSSWFLRNKSVIVEKYEGKVTTEAVVENDDDIYSNANPESKTIRCITDLSQANLDEIDPQKIEELFSSIKSNSDNIEGMMMGFYIGQNSVNNFFKTTTYSSFGDKYKISVNSFTELDSLFDWLNFCEEDRREIKGLLLNIW